MVKAFADDAEVLNMIAWELVTDEDLGSRAPRLGLSAAESAVELTARQNAAILDTLARAHYAIGMIEKAIEIQREALAVAEEGEREGLEPALEYYLEVKAVAESVAGER